MSMRYPGGLIASTPVKANYPSGVWTQAQTVPYASTNVWQRDQYWMNTTLLLHGDGTNGAQNNTFLDSSASPLTITRNGNTTQGAFTPYQQNGYWSNFFTGASGTYLSFANSSSLNIGAGDFTAECWFFPTTKNNNTIFYKGPVAGPTYDYILAYEGTSGLYVGYGGTAVYTAVTDTTVLNAWNHIALVRNTANNTMRVYINGVQAYSATYTGTYASSSGGGIGGTPGLTNTYAFNGYISNVRFTQAAVYTAAFTPPAAPLTAITNTSLLTCQSNRFIDNSASPLTITVNGSPSVQAFQPFPGATTWSASVLGGSGYFDGNLDYLVPVSGASTQFDLGLSSTAFTLEMWVYITGTGFQHFFSKGGGTAGWNSTTGWQYTTYYYSGSIYFDNWNGSTFASSGASLTSNGGSLNGWTHLVFAYNGTTKAIFINGTRATSTSATFAKPSSSTNPPAIGSPYPITGETYHLQGYMANLRVVNGTDVYGVGNSTITVPSSPVTAITNTQLLCNYTNGGIFDNAQMNDLETVGNAQVSTSVVKYGTGSMYYNGSGSYLYGASRAPLGLGGDFTLECWVYPTTLATAYIFGINGSPKFRVYITSGGAVGLDNGTAYIETVSSIIAANVWTHIAVTKTGSNTFTVYVNGIARSVGASSGTMSSSYPAGDVYVGASTSGTSAFTGYIDDLRLTNGVARYTTTFTPPIARMPNQ